MDRIRSPLEMLALVLCVLVFAASPEPAGAETLHIAISDMAFGNSPVAAHVGDVIEWSNRDFVAHTATARDGSFDVVIPPGETGRTALRHAGQTPFYCRYHPTMTGVIDVASVHE